MSDTIALGLGDNIDYEIQWDSSIIEDLIRDYRVSSGEIAPVRRIDSPRNLLISILDYVQNGTGTERYVEDAAIITELAGKFAKEITIGGTAARAAIAMSRLGVHSLLHLVTTNSHVRSLLPPESRWHCSNVQDSLYPHLIVQYEKGARVAARDIEITAPVSSRLIYVNDEDNARMKLKPEFFDDIGKARALLISGFNAMHDGGLLRERLGELVRYMRALPDSLRVFYEDACFHNADFKLRVLDALAGSLDIFSLNEDEMAGYLGQSVDLLDPDAVLEAVQALRAAVQVPVVVIHTRFWAMVAGPDCARYSASLEQGITMAATRFRLGDNFAAADFLATRSFPLNERGSAFSREISQLGSGEMVCLPSKRVEEKNVTTVGLGDAFVGGFLSTFAEENL